MKKKIKDLTFEERKKLFCNKNATCSCCELYLYCHYKNDKTFNNIKETEVEVDE